MTQNAIENVRKKLTQVFTYLQSLDQLRNPVKKSINDQPWRLWFGDLPDHEDVVSDFFSFTNNGKPDEAPVETYLRVRRPELTACPEPSEELLKWLLPGWNKIDMDPEVSESIPSTSENTEGNEPEYFEDDVSRIEQYNIWLDERSQWKLLEEPARETMKIFERLYALSAQMEREQEQVELILGDGILEWRMSGGQNISHPVLLQKVKLNFDPSVPEFMVTPLDLNCQFYNALFRDVEAVRASSVKACIDELEVMQCGPLDQQPTDEYLRRVISQLSAKGKFYPFGEDIVTSRENEPYIRRNPVLFLRKRSMGFANAIERILEHIAQSNVLPEAVTGITGIDLKEKEVIDNETSISLDINGEDEDILFTKDANSEQLDIALKAAQYGSVLVQGPPGTGKTHTIANLIGHFLSQGKNILVTSHTSKALHVLREKVVEPLQDLCVSLVQEDVGNQQMDHSIDAITERLSSINEREYQEEISRFEGRRKQLLQNIRNINKDLRVVRENEYRPIVFLGNEYEPSEAARLIRENIELLAMIPGNVEPGVGLHLDTGEIKELYQSNDAVSSAEEKEFEYLEIHPSRLTNPELFSVWIHEYEELHGKEKDFHKDYWTVRSDDRIEILQTLLGKVQDHFNIYSDEERWKMEIIWAGWKDSIEASLWKELIFEIIELTAMYQAAKTLIYRYDIVIPESDDSFLIRNLDEIISHIQKVGKINKFHFLFHRNWSVATKSIKINGKTPENLEHFQSAAAVLRHRIKRNMVVSRWGRQVSHIGGPTVESLGREPETTLNLFQNQIQELLDLHKNLTTFQLELIDRGLIWERFYNIRKPELVPFSELLHLKDLIINTLPGIIASYCNDIKYGAINNKFSSLLEIIKGSGSSKSYLVTEFQMAVELKDENRYLTAYRQFEYLWNKHEIISKRNILINRLEAVAPGWAAAIRNREGIHGSSAFPVDPYKAWLIKQLECDLERRSALSTDKLQRALIQTRDEFKIITAHLVESKAWLAVKKKTSLTQQNALQGWKLLMKRVGKRTGIRAPHFLAEARKLMPVCQTAVPVWIMPINRVVESFDPATNRFDVVIIDEASQADVMALTALYLGKQVIVVGDDNQVSPDAVGQKQLEVQKLIDMQLTDIPNASLYDGMTSIYDLAQTSFSGITQLREHFRCVEPIIEFSNSLSYKGKILPLRDSSTVATRPFTVSYRVEGDNFGQKTNRVEAETIASLIIAASENEAYYDATFGVISLVGDEQALLIDKYLQRYMTPAEYKRRRIRCGNSAQFQGDERDVIFLSMVHAAQKEGPLAMLGDPGERMKKRYNVAASRAKNQLWLIHSLNETTDLKDGDLRKRLIQHMINPYAVSELMKRAEPRIQSEFERQVMEKLLHEGYMVTPQWKVGAYSIDMVVEDGGQRLAVECDGDRWHPIEKLGDDMARQAILERLGWKFVRIRGSAYFRNPELSMKEVLQTLEKMSITRNLHEMNRIENSDDNHQLKETVILRADQIRRGWNPDNDYEFSPGKKNSDGRKASKNSYAETQSSSSSDAHSDKQGLESDQTETNDQIDLFTFVDMPTASGERFDVISYLSQQGLHYSDKRHYGGALWVVGDKKIEPKLNDLKTHGYRFKYVPNGSQATKRKPGWFTKD